MFDHRRFHLRDGAFTGPGLDQTVQFLLVDAARAMEVIDLSDRAMVKSSLAATLVKDGDHLPVFNTAFEVFFSTRSWQNAEQFMGEGDEDEDQPAGAAA